jgi:predicted enzyme related to lactoylglutathione lyase
MLAESPVIAMLPATNIDRAREFYEQILGLTVTMEIPGGFVFAAGNGTAIGVYQRGPTKADHTVASFQVDNIEDVINALTDLGVQFEHYNMEPGPKTNNLGIAEDPSGGKAAWFKDTEGNILVLVQTP